MTAGTECFMLLYQSSVKLYQWKAHDVYDSSKYTLVFMMIIHISDYENAQAFTDLPRHIFHSPFPSTDINRLCQAVQLLEHGHMETACDSITWTTADGSLV